MAEYISALNGQQMDAALTEVALYNPEAWAVGQRNGVPVTSADETWHNNAKYYAQLAQSVIPGTYTAAVRWDIDQGLAGEAQEQARANISAGASNRNLLDNPWFTYPVNQRSFTSGNSVAYTVDRWKNTTSGATVSLTTGYDGYMEIPANCVFAQYFESTKYASLVGKVVTLSAMLSDGTVTSGTVTVPFSGSQYASGSSVRMAMDGTNARFIVYQSSAVQIRALKVELGSYSTLANDVPPNYGEELRKCQYYFRRITVQDNGSIALGWATSATAAQFPNILGTSPMRAKPTATPTGAVYVRDPSGTDHAVSSFAVQYDPVAVCLQANTSGLTANTVARLRIGAGGRIDLSADL